jgi:hypothetical protein
LSSVRNGDEEEDDDEEEESGGAPLVVRHGDLVLHAPRPLLDERVLHRSEVLHPVLLPVVVRDHFLM